MAQAKQDMGTGSIKKLMLQLTHPCRGGAGGEPAV